MMQSCASAAKLRSGGSILPVGTKAKVPAGIPPPRTVIRVSSQADGRDRNCEGAFSVVHSLCRTQNNAVWYNTGLEGECRAFNTAPRFLRFLRFLCFLPPPI